MRLPQGDSRLSNDDEPKEQVAPEPGATGLPGTVRIVSRPVTTDFNDRLRVGGSYALKSIERALFGGRFNKVVAHPISCDTCFSHARKDEFLVASRSLDPLAYDLDFQAEATRRLTHVKSAVESNGVTRFRTLVFPNKINVYEAYVPQAGAASVFNPEFAASDIGLVPLLARLREAVDMGMTDVYLPNDHHTGSIGYRLAADAVSESLEWPALR